MKNNLKLDIEALDIESFEPAQAQEKLGTVHGHVTLYCTGDWDTCDNCNTMSCDSRFEQCMPTLYGITCEYETCGACNQTDRYCTTYCP